VVGGVFGSLPWTDVVVSTQTGRARVSFEENAGLATVAPMEAVLEVVRASLEDDRQRAAGDRSGRHVGPAPQHWDLAEGGARRQSDVNGSAVRCRRWKALRRCKEGSGEYQGYVRQ
jgi:hypothetical protein